MSKTDADMVFVIAESGSEINELEVPINELLKDYKKSDENDELNHGQ